MGLPERMENLYTHHNLSYMHLSIVSGALPTHLLQMVQKGIKSNGPMLVKKVMEHIQALHFHKRGHWQKQC